MALNDKPVVGAGGGVYFAPAGTAVPTSFDDFDATPFVKLGYIAEEGLSWAAPVEATQDMNVWQLAFPWDIVTTGITSSFAFKLVQWTKATISFALGGGTWVDNGPDDTTTYVPPALGDSTEGVVALVVNTSAGSKVAVVFGSAKVTARDALTFNKSTMAEFGVTVTMLGVEDADPYNLLFVTADLGA